ncbi:MAG: redoxin domain-containing protein [Bacteroidales bacterium]|nr:redoxin domain-containing protein [Bacteroidales bacterium]
MKKIGYLLAILLFCVVSVSGQNEKKGHDIKINIKGWDDDFCLLAHYFGNGQYLDDTLWIKNSTIRIQGDTALRNGMYLIINPQKVRLIEFFVDQQQHFTITSDTLDLLAHIKVVGSESNQRFYEWVQFLNMIRTTGDHYKALADSFRTAENVSMTEFYQAKFDSITHLHQQKWNVLFNTDTSLLISRFMKAQQGVSIHRFKADGTPFDQIEQYLYMKNHYFDNMNLSDIDLLYTPVYHKNLQNFFEKVIQQTTDSLIIEGMKTFHQASGHLETKYYVAWYVTNYAESSKLMGMDRAFVYFVDQLFASGAVDGIVMPALKESLKNRADEMRQSLIGEIAPNIAAWDTAQRVLQLYHVPANYTIVFFFSTTCGHCKAEAQALKKIYTEQKNEIGFEVFAVCTDSSMTGLKKYITQNQIPWIVVNGTYTAGEYFKNVYDIPTTPSLFLLDKRKKIIAKNLNTENTFEYLKEYERINGKRK